MKNDKTDIKHDIWAEWLRRHLHCGNVNIGRLIRHQVEYYTKRVLDGIPIAADTTLVDIGSGDGMLAFHAIRQIGPALQVIFTDVSPPPRSNIWNNS